MLGRLMPQGLWHTLQRRMDARRLATIRSADFDLGNLRSSFPDYSAFDSEWPSVEQLQRSIGMADPEGGVNPGDRRLLYQVARAMRATSLLEVGTHVGASTLVLALAANRNGGHLTTVDIADVNADDAEWKRRGCRFRPSDTLARAGVVATFHRSDSVAWLAADRGSYDLIFLDGLHEAQQLYRELPLALRRLNPDGLILLHDVFPNYEPLWADGYVIPGPWMAVERCGRECSRLRVQPLGELPWPTKQGSNITSLAAVLRDRNAIQLPESAAAEVKLG